MAVSVLLGSPSISSRIQHLLSLTHQLRRHSLGFADTRLVVKFGTQSRLHEQSGALRWIVLQTGGHCR